jgi:hypothetical protein
MKKAIWLILLAFLLACGPSTAETQPTTVAAVEETAVAPTEVIVETEEPEVEEPEAEETLDANNETAQSAPPAANLGDFSPASTVEEAAVVRQQDWLKGATDPIVVIIEYGDFQ